METTSYNARFQPTSIQAGNVMTLGYTYGTTQNNGNVLSQSITRGSQTWTQSYSYADGMNRLTGASESGSGSWSQGYGYDNFGNRWLSSYSGLPSPTNQVPTGSTWYSTTNNNRIVSPSGAWTYDASGNLQAMAGMPGWGFTYDAENRQITAVTASSPTTTYQYDGEGRRVTKNWNGQVTTFVYDAFGNLAAEYGAANPSTGTQYLTTDHLGSTRLITDSSGAVVKCYDYLPFGEEIGSGTAGRPSSCFGSGSYPVAGGATNTEFTSKERDAETGLDFFEARYMSSPQARFTSVDPENAGGLSADPQSWNGYTYARNNPLLYADPDGEMYRICATGFSCFDAYDSDFADYQKTSGYWFSDGTIYANPGSGSVEVGSYWWTGPDLPVSARQVLGQVGQETAPVAESVMQGLKLFASVAISPLGVAAVECLVGDPGCSRSSVALAMIPRGGSAETEIRVTWKGLLHVIQRHTGGMAGKSFFSDSAAITGLVKGAESVVPARSFGDKLVRTVDAGRVIGTDVTTGQQTSIYTVITDTKGELVTAYPGRPRR